MSLPSLPGACRKWGVQVYGLVWLGGTPYTSVLPLSVCSASCRPLLWGEETEVRSTGQKLRKHISTPLTVVYSIAEIKAVNWKWPTKNQTLNEIWWFFVRLCKTSAEAKFIYLVLLIQFYLIIYIYKIILQFLHLIKTTIIIIHVYYSYKKKKKHPPVFSSAIQSHASPSANPTLINPDVKADSLWHQYKHTLLSFKHHLIPQAASSSPPTCNNTHAPLRQIITEEPITATSLR